MFRRLALAGWLAMASVRCFGSDVQRVDPAISIIDIHGQVQHPFLSGSKAASIIFFITNDCPIANSYAREIHRICDAYSGHASCALDYVDPNLTAQQAAKHVADYGHGDYPAIVDTKQILVKAAGATVTPEVVVVLGGGRIAYRGRIDNKYVGLGAARLEATQRDLRVALDAVLQGRPVETPRTKGIGCFITPIELLRR